MLSGALGGAHPGPGPGTLQCLPGEGCQPLAPLARPAVVSQTRIKARVTYRAVRESILRQNYRGEEKDFYQINEKSIWLQKSISPHDASVTSGAAQPTAAVRYGPPPPAPAPHHHSLPAVCTSETDTCRSAPVPPPSLLPPALHC